MPPSSVDLSHAEPRAAYCRNCDIPFPRQDANFCGHCGQERHLEVPSVGEFAHELIGHYVALEGKLATTLRKLLATPGHLTRDYLDGKRQRYIAPLRLYLSVSLVFFVLFKLFGPAHGVLPAAATNAERVSQAVVQYGALSMFLLIPLFTVFLRVLYPGRRMNFGSHLVFAFHVHAWLFLLFSVALFLPAGRWTGLALIVFAGVYLQWALQVVYGGRWLLNVARLLILIFLYGLFTTAFAGAMGGLLIVLGRTA